MNFFLIKRLVLQGTWSYPRFVESVTTYQFLLKTWLFCFTIYLLPSLHVFVGMLRWWNNLVSNLSTDGHSLFIPTTLTDSDPIKNVHIQWQVNVQVNAKSNHVFLLVLILYIPSSKSGLHYIVILWYHPSLFPPSTSIKLKYPKNLR